MKERFLPGALAATFLLVAGCGESESGPLRVSAVGTAPAMVNPNLRAVDAATAFLLEAVAQGLVRFDASGEIEPALAQSWIVSDDGLRYTFRIRRAVWGDGSRVTAEQVAARLRATVSRASRSPLKPVLGAIDNVVAMTDQVLEISLKGPRPNLLQLLAQPEMGLILNGRGTGPYAIAGQEDGILRLAVPRSDEEETENAGLPEILLRGERSATAAARFAQGEADLVIGGTVGDLAFARAAGIASGRLVFDPAAGLFGFAFTAAEGPFADAGVRRAMSMALDRDGLIAAFAIPGLRPRLSLVPVLGDELPRPSMPDWAELPLPMRRELATRVIAELDIAPTVKVALPDGPGYRLLFAYLRRDWRVIGIEAVRVAADAPADLRLIDVVAPGSVTSWYLRHFTCSEGRVCDPGADEALESARIASSAEQRQAQLAAADQILSALTPFIPIAAPIRWSMVSPRVTGFRPNVFVHHPAGTLIAQE